MSNTGSLCVHTPLDDSIHQFVFIEASREAVDEYLRHLQTVIEQLKDDEPLLMLMDLRPDGIPPLKYALTTSKRFFARYPNLPPTKAAYITNSTTLVGLGLSVLSLIGTETKRRNFSDHEEYQAIEWLLEIDNI
jgi:hypothetical protein